MGKRGTDVARAGEKPAPACDGDREGITDSIPILGGSRDNCRKWDDHWIPRKKVWPMPRRIVVTVEETTRNARVEDLPGVVPGRKPPKMPIAKKAKALSEGRRLARGWSWSPDRIQGVGPSADDALRHAMNILAGARRMK